MKTNSYMQEKDIITPKGWENFFIQESQQEYFLKLQNEIKEERNKFDIFPVEDDVFKAFKLKEPEKVKVVILGQDPYPTPGDACGLAFSVKDEQPLPRSLRNIFKEISFEYGTEIRTNGDLSGWARQGVFLLNTVLTVRNGEAGSHRGYGWEIFTDHTISYLNRMGHPIVFMLWGADAGKKETLITNPKHLIIKTAHPSPLSACRGFFGSGCFKKTNDFLEVNGLLPVIWQN